mmetsp:Transcript_57941/g.188450  ORF Transcript_57941/g.188450 Transcript_57941/m.188450 type:complete len:454 (+) Transcript_57941:2-1363(+)
MLLDLTDDMDDLATSSLIYHCLKTLVEEEELSLSRVQGAVQQLKAIQNRLPDVPMVRTFVPTDSIELSTLAYLLTVPQLLSFADLEHLDDVRIVVHGLRIVSMEELVEVCTRGHKVIFHGELSESDSSKFERILNMVVMGAVVVNLVTMGIQVDREANHIGWLCLEIACVGIYTFELFAKLIVFGPKVYFTGPTCYWNMLDGFITTISIFELSLEVAKRLDPWLMGSEGGKASSVAQVAILLRVLRVARVMRMVKLVRSPMLADLANMLSGFLIGIPALLWVLAFFVFILYMVGLMFRLAFGPLENESYTWRCGAADDITNFSDPECPVHFVYGEEFFGTMSKAMFTTFRFMLGDYSTRGGKSIVVAFSAGYGAQFEIIFVGWMIVVIFGLTLSPPFLSTPRFRVSSTTTSRGSMRGSTRTSTSSVNSWSSFSECTTSTGSSPRTRGRCSRVI